jgi:hypothetical protein
LANKLSQSPACLSTTLFALALLFVLVVRLLGLALLTLRIRRRGLWLRLTLLRLLRLLLLLLPRLLLLLLLLLRLRLALRLRSLLLDLGWSCGSTGLRLALLDCRFRSSTRLHFTLLWSGLRPRLLHAGVLSLLRRSLHGLGRGVGLRLRRLPDRLGSTLSRLVALLDSRLLAYRRVALGAALHVRALAVACNAAAWTGHHTTLCRRAGWLGIAVNRLRALRWLCPHLGIVTLVVVPCDRTRCLRWIRAAARLALRLRVDRTA